MRIKLVRESFTDKATEGKLYINDVFECYTLEDCDRRLEVGGTKIYGATAIPRGTSAIDISYSEHFNKRLPILLNVPQYEGVRIHTGNSNSDTAGCVIVGSQNASETDDFIGGSKIAFEPLFEKIQTAIRMGDTVTIEIC